MKNNKEQTFIKLKGKNGNYYNKDIKESTFDERRDYYLGLSFGQLMGVLEDVLGME